jgi:large subunit ribosomal protein L25
MAKNNTIDFYQRNVLGKKVKHLRRQGITPVHMYDSSGSSYSLQVETKTLYQLLASHGKTSPVTIRIGEEDHSAFVREVQRNPVSEEIIHVDFLEVDLSKSIRTQVPVVLVGEAPAVRLHSGIVNQLIYSLSLECLPKDIPSSIEIDVSGLDEIDASVLVSDINLGASVTITSSLQENVVRIQAPRKVEDLPGGADLVAEESDGLGPQISSEDSPSE